MMVPDPDPTREQEPLGWFERDAAASEPGTRTRCFEISSRGDRVTGLLSEPAAESASPLLLVAQATPEAGTPALLPLCRRVVRSGVAVAQIDLPLHGARAEHKLAECVVEGFAGHGPMAPLAQEFMSQAVTDLRRCLDALSAVASIDASRVAFAGALLAAEVGARFCALDGRPRAAILALGGRPSQSRDLDASASIGAIAPRPVLVIDAPADSSDGPAPGRLYEAAGAPRTHRMLETVAQLDADELQREMESFLIRALDL